MYVKNRLASIIYKSIIVLLSGYGIFLYSGIPDGKFAPLMFSYYTIQSNILVFFFYLFGVFASIKAVRKTGINGSVNYFPRFKGAVVMAITVTMLIYQFLLAKTPFSMGGGDEGISSVIVHLFVPVMVLLDWILFDAKGHYRWYDCLIWTVIPLIYYGYTLIAALLGIRYKNGSSFPYFFIDPARIGWGKVALYIVFLWVAFVILGCVFIALDKGMARFKKQKKSS